MSGWRSVWCPVAVAVVPTCLLLIGVAVPGGYYTVLTLALVGWATVAWLCLVVGAGQVGHPVRRWWPLLLVPALCAASWAAASAGLVGPALFPLHRSALEKVVSVPGAKPPPSVGLYSFRGRYKNQGCTFFITNDPGMTRAAGFVWCPGSNPAATTWDEAYRFEPLGGDWYAFHLGRSTRAGGGAWRLRLSALSPPIET
ncbi:hypothetical protein ACIA8G_05110 [Lentzea sp. NPDC051213]|uniref:hypothetical protein n=1 Tax=Lentzea sp. NPDC051213 TaxID=3364126 RepID=UPI0037B49DFC